MKLKKYASECGISHTTVKSWINILEASYIIFLLRPHHKNFNKRLVKMPKLYFYDTGLAASLLSIKSRNQLDTHYIKGSLFESFIISDFIKRYYNNGEEHSLFFWRDKNGHEIDCIIETANLLTPVEIKSGRTITGDHFKDLEYWRKLSGNTGLSFLIYGGDMTQKRSSCNILPWNRLDKLKF